MRDTRAFGTAQELKVANYLEGNGYRILEHGYRCKSGEIDLIAQKNCTLVFVEVKYRGGGQYGTPYEAVDYRKQVRISNAALYYMYSHHWPMDTPCRFDVAAVSGNTIELMENAFEYCGRNY